MYASNLALMDQLDQDNVDEYTKYDETSGVISIKLKKLLEFYNVSNSNYSKLKVQFDYTDD